MVRLEVKLCSAEQSGPLEVCSAAVDRDLGLLLDSELSMKQHVNKVAAICSIYAASARSAVKT